MRKLIQSTEPGLREVNSSFGAEMAERGLAQWSCLRRARTRKVIGIGPSHPVWLQCQDSVWCGVSRIVGPRPGGTSEGHRGNWVSTASDPKGRAGRYPLR
jgi:hypothetical protein